MADSACTETESVNVISAHSFTIGLVYLPDDVLLWLARFLDVQTLGRLIRTCRRFRRLLSQDCVWLPYSRKFTLVNPRKSDVSLRYLQNNTLKERCRIARNWMLGRFKDKTFIKYTVRQLPWLQIYGPYLWVSSLNSLHRFRILHGGEISRGASLKLRMSDTDVCHFKCRQGRIVTGSICGSIGGWDAESGRRWFHYPALHSSTAQCVDMYHNVIVSGSKDTYIKIMSVRDNGSCDVLSTVPVHDRLWSLAVSPDGSSFVSGTAGLNIDCPLALWDLNRCQKVCSLGPSVRHGAGVLDIKYESPHTVLACGYDTYLRLWDTRVQECVLKWMEPYDNVLYSLDSDENNVVVTGTARYGMTELWDKRKTTPVQLYFCGQHNSPVYSVTLTANHLYTALDMSLHCLDFAAR